MRIVLPSRRWVALAMSLVVPLVWAIATMLYFQALLETGTLSPDADSIGIPILSNFIIAGLAAPLMFGVAWAATPRDMTSIDLLAWREDRLIESLAVAIVFGGPSVALLASIIFDLGRKLVGYEHILSIGLIAVAGWLWMMRCILTGALERSAALGGEP